MEPGDEGGRGEVVWAPRADAIDTSRVGAFMAWLASARGVRVDDYQSVWRWSVDDLEGFWGAFSEWVGVRWRTAPSAVLGDRSMPGAVWFPGATVNWAEQALAPAGERADQLAVIARSQTRDEVTLTWAELVDAVARCRAGLQRLGVGRGDRVCAYLPNIPET